MQVKAASPGFNDELGKRTPRYALGVAGTASEGRNKTMVRSPARWPPTELVTLAAFAIAIFGVVATGSAIAAAIKEPSPWLFAAAYGGPAALATGLYWSIARKLGGLRSARDLPPVEAYTERCDWDE
jgi:hypothetical protein